MDVTKVFRTKAKSLGYKDITWETIQNPYLPTGLQQDAEMEKEFKRYQLEWVKQEVPQQTQSIPKTEQQSKTDN